MEAGDEQAQRLQAPPQRPDARHSIFFSIQMSSQATDPQGGLTDRDVFNR